MKTKIAIAVLAGLTTSAAPEAAAARLRDGAAPAWFREHLELLVGDGSPWIADNERHRSAAEPYEAYAMEWSWGIGRSSACGRLAGLIEDQEAAPIWEYRVFWDLAANQARVLQFGADGTHGAGTLEPVGEGGFRVEVFLVGPDGSSQRFRDEGVQRDADFKDTRSYRWSGDDWLAMRHYEWMRAPVEDGG